MTHYNDYAMRAKIDECLKTVAVVLDTNKSASIAAADRVSHQYEDKYLLANHLTNTTIACVLNGLELIGVSHSELSSLRAWNVHRAVSLKFERRQKCKFIKEIEREVEDPSRVQVDAGIFRSTVKVITKVKEYIYLIEEEYTLSAHSGVGDNPAEVIHFASASSQLETTLRTNSAPFSESTVDTFNVNISWLLKHLDEAASTATFAIDRAHSTCATPRQNVDVAAALQFHASFSSFCSNVYTKLHHLHDVQSRYGVVTAAKFDMASVNTEGIFNPVVPLFENGSIVAVEEKDEEDEGEQAVVPAGGAVDHHSVALPQPIVNQLVQEQRRSLAAKCTQVASLFTAAATAATTTAIKGVFGASEATLMVVLLHLGQFSQYYQQGVDFIEHMIRQQLVAAVGKELTARDFAQYMTFHNRKVFKEAYQPQPFSYAVRRSPVHSPEGQIQIETAEVTPAEPIYTVSQHTENAPHMEFALNATTTVKFGGERHLHGWMAHRFSGQALPELKLVAEARQFSSYIVLIGRIASAKLFQPKYGFIVQNKDEFRIPLDLEQIPTAKEFKDAISSLSPEQQRFAKAFRSMQLESTLFGVCVIQIKPQLEKVLKLQADSLTKEIKLTQDLMQLFIKYQIPSDLLSFDDSVQGGASVPAAERLVKVKRHVQAMQEMLASAKDEEVAAANQQREFEYGVREVAVKEDFCDFEYQEERCYSAPTAVLETCAAPSFSSKKKSGGPSFNLGGMMRRSSASSAPPPPPAAAAAPMKRMEKREVAAPSVSKSSVAPPAPKPSAVVAPPSAAAPTPAVKDTASAPEYSTQVKPSAQGEQVDYTQYPNKLEEMYTRYDPDSSLRPTIINPGATWTKRAQAGLLSAPQTTSLSADLQASEKNAAFDLLDALTRSGALPIEHASLHVIIAATHCFDQSLMDTVVQKNVNPIERVERSTLLMAAALNDVPAAELITEGQLDRVSTFSPMLFDNASIEN